MSDTFKQDLPVGEEAEYNVLAMVKKKYPNAYKIQGEFKAYDIYVPEKDIKIEVKRDIGSNNSNNYFIECFCNGEASGIFSTEADYWVIFDENKYIWIDKSVLWNISTNRGIRWEGTPNGGCSNVVAYLVPKDEICLHANKILFTKPQ